MEKLIYEFKCGYYIKNEWMKESNICVNFIDCPVTDSKIYIRGNFINCEKGIVKVDWISNIIIRRLFTNEKK